MTGFETGEAMMMVAIRTIALSVAGPALLGLAAPSLVYSQDYDPSMAAHEATGRSQFATQESQIGKRLYRNDARGSATTSGVRGTPSRSARTCANLPAARARLGGDDPRIIQLTKLCKRAGY